MNNTLKNSLERLKSIKIILPEVCLHPGEPIHLNKWLKRTAMNSAGRVEIDKDIRERLYSKVKQRARGKSITFDQRKEVPLLPLLLANVLMNHQTFTKYWNRNFGKYVMGIVHVLFKEIHLEIWCFAISRCIGSHLKGKVSRSGFLFS